MLTCRYVQSHQAHSSSVPSQHSTLSTSRNHKARFLHYFPRDEVLASTLSSTSSVMSDDVGQGPDQANSDANKNPLVSLTSSDHEQPWCSWHTDHSSLTGLTRAMYVNRRGREVQCPDAGAGLYVRNRTGQVIKINIPEDHLAFQVGRLTVCMFAYLCDGLLCVEVRHRRVRLLLTGLHTKYTACVFMMCCGKKPSATGGGCRHTMQ